MKRIFTALICSAYILNVGCTKLVEVDAPITRIAGNNVFSNDGTATAVFTGMYTRLSANRLLGDFAINTSSIIAGLTADEFTLWEGISDPTLSAHYKNQLTIQRVNNGLWFTCYNYIYSCNAALEGLSSNDASGLTPGVRDQLMGEAKFMRALLYFSLVNYYGGVPLVLSTDYKVNSNLGRSTVTEVYKRIVADLDEAKELLSDNYVDGTSAGITSERVRPNRYAASALLARAYLYTGEWANAERESTSVIDKTSLYDLMNVSISQVFLANSKEAIWQLQPVTTGITNTSDGNTLILSSKLGVNGPDEQHPVYLNTDLVGSFSDGDLRKMEWIDSVVVEGNTYYYPYKYKVGDVDEPVTEYQMVLRLGEQFLIRAEARARLGKIEEAKTDLDVVRARAGLAGSSANTAEALIDSIMVERRLELFSEHGHRWLDLKRSGKLKEVMEVAAQRKGSIWHDYQSLFPIPATEIAKNTALSGHQNAEY